MEPKGTLGIVIISDNAPAKVVTVWPWHYDEPRSILCQVNAKSNQLFQLLENHSSFRFQYLLLIMTIQFLK